MIFVIVLKETLTNCRPYYCRKRDELYHGTRPACYDSTPIASCCLHTTCFISISRILEHGGSDVKHFLVSATARNRTGEDIYSFLLVMKLIQAFSNSHFFRTRNANESLANSPVLSCKYSNMSIFQHWNAFKSTGRTVVVSISRRMPES